MRRPQITQLVTILFSCVIIAGCGASSSGSTQPTKIATLPSTPLPTATDTPNVPALDGTFTSPDGLYTFKYKLGEWSNATFNDSEFPTGNSLVSTTFYLFNTLPATREIAPADYPAVITKFLKSTFLEYDATNYTAAPSVTLGASTWSVGNFVVIDSGVQRLATFYAILHNGTTFFIVTTGPLIPMYFHTMLVSFAFLK